MSDHGFLSPLALVVMSVTALLSCVPVDDSESGTGHITVVAEDETVQHSGLPPLVINKEAPLLLADQATSSDTAGGDNATCFVCHVNYTTELLAGQHAAIGIACVDCHGESSAHKNDEDNITPPDIMYANNEINRSCGKCHTTHDVSAAKVVACWFKRRPNETNPSTVVCTDCHGDHRLRLRAVQWDKKTGKLLPGDKRQ